MLLGKFFKRTIVSFCVSLLFVNYFSQSSECSASLSRLKQKAESMRRKIEENKKNIKNQTKSQEGINEKISKLKYEIDSFNIKVFELNKQVLKEKQDIINYQEEISKSIQNLGGFLTSLYKANSPGVLEIVLTSKSFGDLLDKIKLAKFFSHKITVIVKEIDQKVLEVTRKKQQNEKNLKEIENYKIVLVNNRQGLEELFQKSKLSQQHSETAIEEDENELKRVFDAMETERKKLEILRKQNQVKNSIFSVSAQSGNFKIGYPIKGAWIITSDFNDTRQRKKAHGAMDFSGPNFYGTEILAAADGEVVYVNAGNWGGGYGTYTIINHGNGFVTLYAHMSKLTVEKGQKVKKSDVIGYSGNSGFSTGSHLHFELRRNGKQVNPKLYF